MVKRSKFYEKIFNFIVDAYNGRYGTFRLRQGFPELSLDIEEAREVTVEVTRVKEKGMDEVVSVPTYVVKIDGKWYGYMRHF